MAAMRAQPAVRSVTADFVRVLLTFGLLLHVLGQHVDVAVMIPLEGPLASSGANMQRAAALFAAARSATAGNSSFTLALHVTDVGDTASTVVATVTGLVAAGVTFFVGPYGLPASIAMLNQLQNISSGYVAILPGVTSSSLFTPALSLLAAQRASTIFQVQDGTAFAVDACGVALPPSMSVVGSVNLNSNPSTLVPDPAAVALALDRISRLQPDIVLLCGSAVSAGTVISAARTNNVNAPAWVTASVLDAGYITGSPERFGLYTLDASFWSDTSTVGAVPPLDTTCGSLGGLGCVTPAAFAGMWRAAYGGASIPLEAVTTFAALELLAQALDGTGSVSTDAVAAYLAGRNFDTAFGRVAVGLKTGQNTGETGARQVQGRVGQVVNLLPLAVANGSIIYPAPTWRQAACVSNGACINGRCVPSGDCACNGGYSGANCAVSYAAPLIAVGSIIGTALLLAALYVALRLRRQALTSRQVALEQAMRDAALDATRHAYQRSLMVAAHELANPIFAIGATLAEARETGATVAAEAVTRMDTSVAQLERVMRDMAAAARLYDVTSNATGSAVVLADAARDVSHRIRQLHALAVHMRVEERCAALMLALDVVQLHQLLLCACSSLPAPLPRNVDATVTCTPDETTAVETGRVLREGDTPPSPSMPTVAGTILGGPGANPAARVTGSALLTFVITPGAEHAAGDSSPLPSRSGVLPVALFDAPARRDLLARAHAKLSNVEERPGIKLELPVRVMDRAEPLAARAIGQAAPAINDPPQAADVQTPGPLRVLIVEDELVNARVVTRMVERCSGRWTSDLVYDGLDIPFLQADGDPDSHAQYACILLDIVMRRSHGVDIATRILAAGYTGLLVAMTSNTGSDDLATYKRVGFHTVLGKPFTTKDLQRVLAQAAAMRRGAQEAGARSDVEVLLQMPPQLHEQVVE